MLDAEDARVSDSVSLAPILAGLRSTDIGTRRVAVRAIGRMERRENLRAIEPMLTDPSPLVRAEAFNAIAQIAKGDAATAPTGADASTRVWMGVQGLMRGLAASETDPLVRGVMARTLGRLPYPTEDVARAATESIAALMDGIPSDGQLGREPWFGILHGTDAILRRFPNLRNAPGVVRVAQLPRVPSVATSTSSDSTWSREASVILSAVRGRTLAVAAGSPTGIDDAAARAIRARFLSDFGDADAQVRRQVVTSIAGAAALDDSSRARVVNAALGDPSFSVRIEAVRAYARRRGAPCRPLITATRDASAHVALTAIDALAGSCEPSSDAIARLSALVRELPPRATPRSGTRGSWHAAAHAVVALARLSPDSVRAMMPRLVTHPVWQVRMYAARAAGELADMTTLGALARDRSDNVRDAAVVAISSLVRPVPAGTARPRIERSGEIDSIFTSELVRSDYQLILDAAKALEGATASARLGEALLQTMDRLSAERRETSRDPRMELLARIETFGGSNHTPRIRAYLTDFDPAIAERAAQVLRAWGTVDAVASPRRLAPIPVSLADIVVLRNARVRITMAPESGGGSFEMRLFVDEAPATISRFMSNARRGYYNGLTFHRVATNFVIQGGSPGANEYVGADRFMRDEVGLRSHERGTLGISTRGRDTGDAQMFVNLIDNWRLDHDYTVFAEVVKGIDVVDAVLEGDVIARVEVLGAR
jgi:cyclophilin family peptidyl-prolyl cis-trans isomerase/HEAT repeat protein